MRKALLLALLAAAAFVPAAAASSPHKVKLALVPLPKSALGPTASAFKVAYNSGPVSNASAASHTSDATKATLTKLGRVNGYALEYGNAFTGAAGLTDVHTNIEQYKTKVDARRGLAFWKKEDSELGQLNQPGFSVLNVQVKVPIVGSRHFAYLTTYSAANIAPVTGIDEQFVEGKYVLEVIATAGTPSIATALAPKLAKKLDARLKLALRGRLHAKAVHVPKLEAGPPAGGPDLTKLALKGSDLVGEVTADKEFLVDPAAISDYSVLMLPAGPFDVLDQEIEWYPVANEASFYADFENAAALAAPQTTALDLSSLGDGAQGSVTSGSQLSTGQVFFSSGQLAEFVFMGSQKSIVPTAVTNLAQTVASRIDAAGLGTS
jgi:opacity protein-like surface antigen